MKKTVWIAAILSVCLLFAGCNGITNLQQIDVEQAKSIALAALELNGTEISYMEAELKVRNGQKYYDINLVVDGITYEMDVDALTGVIIEKTSDEVVTGTEIPLEEIDPEMNVYPLSPSAECTVVIENYTSAVGATLTYEPTEGDLPDRFVPGDRVVVEPEVVRLIGFEEALDIAVAHVGLRAEDVTPLYVWINFSNNDGNPWDGGIRREQDVYFRDASGMTYHVEVEAEEGEVLSMEKSMDVNDLHTPNHEAQGDVTLPAGAISAERAIIVALNKASLNREDVTVLACAPDLDSGTYEYDVMLKVNGSSMYHTFEIRAMSGGVIRHARGVSMLGDLDAEVIKGLVLEQVKGATVKDITAFELDTDDGKRIYQGTVVYDGMAYHFEIDGYSGAIRSWTVEPVLS